jgi:hypothetical protein
MSRKRTPDQESPETTTTAAADPPAAEAKPEGKSFADRVGQRKRVPTPDPFPIVTDAVAGVKLFEDKRERLMVIKFDEKPPQAVIDMLNEGGYRWNRIERVWAHPVTDDSAMRTRIEAEWLYQEIRQMIRQEKGIDPAPELPS